MSANTTSRSGGLGSSADEACNASGRPSSVRRERRAMTRARQAHRRALRGKSRQPRCRPTPRPDRSPDGRRKLPNRREEGTYKTGQPPAKLHQMRYLGGFQKCPLSHAHRSTQCLKNKFQILHHHRRLQFFIVYNSVFCKCTVFK